MRKRSKCSVLFYARHKPSFPFSFFLGPYLRLDLWLPLFIGGYPVLLLSEEHKQRSGCYEKKYHQIHEYA